MEDAVIEFGNDCVIVELDGIRAEVRGGEGDMRSVKRAVARMLLSQIASLPDQREYERENALRAAQQRTEPYADRGLLGGEPLSARRAFR